LDYSRKVTEKVASEKPAYRGLSGRGGAGNWRQANEEEERKKTEEEAMERSKVDEQVRIDVEAMMKPPPRAYGKLEKKIGTFNDDIV
jgi:hypothetical protein